MNTTQKLIGFLSVLLALAIDAQAQSFPTNGLVAYYPFKGNANDATGNGNNGQIIGNVVPVTDRFGNPSNAYHFDGTNAMIQVTNTVINIGQQGYTVSGWFSFDNVSQPLQQIFNSIPETGFGEGLNGGGVPEDLEGGVGPALGYWTVVPIYGAKTNYVDTNWYQVIFTKSGTTYTSYINGQEDFQTVVSDATNYDYEVGVEFGAVNTNYAVLKGRLDDFRIYDRALSTDEVQELYAYESAPPNCVPSSATATATVTDGFVVAATITDGGCGYTNAPSVQIVGGGGTGATATAVVTNGFVEGIAITDAGTGYTSIPAIYISPPSGCVPHSAEATLTVSNGFVISATVTDPGCGYTNAPSVQIVGGGGTGATATTVFTNGEVVGITITDAGVGYTNSPGIYFSSPLGVEIGLLQAVQPTFSNLFPGENYQLQSSTDLITWTNQGPAFMATNTTMNSSQYFTVLSSSQLYFRLQGAP